VSRVGSVLLGVREMRRAKGRFALLTGAVGILVFLIVYQQALTAGLVTEFIGAIRNQASDVIVYGEDARLDLQGSVVQRDAVARVAAVDGVADAGPLGVATVTVDAGGELRDATLFGHVLGGPGEPVELAKGRRPRRDGEAVASASAAGDGFAVGDRVVVRPGGKTIQIVGSADSTSFSVTPTLFVSYATFESVRRSTNPDAAGVVPSAVAVRVARGADAGAVASRIDDRVDGVEAATRARAAREAPGVASVSQSFGVVLLLTYVVAMVVIGFFFLILTVQKRATLTLLRAIGAPTRRLVVALAVQVAAVVIGGLAVGTALAALALTSASTGIDARLEPPAVAGTTIALLVLAALACIGATRRIVRLDPFAATLPGVGSR
jgi:putative ABC transport system permease protein